MKTCFCNARLKIKAKGKIGRKKIKELGLKYVLVASCPHSLNEQLLTRI